jgi:anaerobic dimethyl sulfoxide reductase subunit B (iron-sulfur subunit)
MGFYFDAGSCIGCKTCEISCKDIKNLPMGVRLRKVREYAGGTWVEKDGFLMPNGVFTYFVSASCMHCAEPFCMGACSYDAISKMEEDGIVTIDKNKCIGCRDCESACPYGAPSFDSEKKLMEKCDMCLELLTQGENPACVDGCLQRCLKIGELSELRKKYGTVASIAPLPEADLTGPSVVITPHKYAPDRK